MEANLAAPEVKRTLPDRFPYSNWGAGAAVLGVVLAIGIGLVLSTVGALFPQEPDGDFGTTGSAVAQLGLVLSLLLTPMAIAAWRGADGLGEILARLGLRRFRLSALKWMAAAVGAYLLFAALYVTLVMQPEQEDIAESFGPVPVQILLIVLGASIAEEVCFRGFLFGGLREKMPRYVAALIAGAIFGALHAATGISAVPPLIFFGFVLCLLYEKTGSIVPGIILHMLNNSAALLSQ